LNQINHVLKALRQVIRATDLHSKHLSKTVGLTAPQVLVMQAISDNRDVTIGEIAKAISLGQATVTTIVTRLELKGYLQRQKSGQDRRKVFVTLTRAGAEILKSAPTPLQERFIEQFHNLDEWEKSMILSALQRVAKMMDAEQIDASPVLDVGDLDRHIGQRPSAQAGEGASGSTTVKQTPEPSSKFLQ
jgi:DNA-binding MarR family transcriptional regulator